MVSGRRSPAFSGGPQDALIVAMKLGYLRSAEPGLRWMRAYDRRNSQLDIGRAAASLRIAETVLREHPAAGRRFEDFDAVREYPIPGTSFSLLSAVARETVWVIDVRDQRGQRSAEALGQFLQELSRACVDRVIPRPPPQAMSRNAGWSLAEPVSAPRPGAGQRVEGSSMAATCSLIAVRSPRRRARAAASMSARCVQRPSAKISRGWKRAL